MRSTVLFTLVAALSVGGIAHAQKKPMPAPMPIMPALTMTAMVAQLLPEAQPSALRGGRLRAWFVAEEPSLKIEPCPHETKCVSRWENKANPANPAVSQGESFRPTIERIAGRWAVRFGINPRKDGNAPTLTALKFDARAFASRPYTVVAVVSRRSDKPENYFFGTQARKCTLGGCEANSGLHLGWRADRTLTVDPYGNGLNIDGQLPFAAERLSLVTVTAGPNRVHLDIEEGGVRSEALRPSFTPLTYAETGYIGMGASYRTDILGVAGANCDGHCYSGYILELAAWDDDLSLTPEGRTTSVDVELVKAYLRRKHALPLR